MMDMVDLRASAVRIGTKRRIATAGLVIAIGTMLLATEVPSAVLSAGGGTTALAELLARSPGARVGGVALKAKERRAALAAAPSTPSGPAGASPSAALSPVAGGGTAPEGPIPGFAPGGVPSDVFPPAVPQLAVAGPGGDIPTGFGFPTTPIPGAGGGTFFVPGGGGGGGGGTGITPEPGPGTPTPVPTGPVPGPVAPVPEPGTWLMLIAGFGMIGGAMRRRRRFAVA